jgi:hypothetical protein
MPLTRLGRSWVLAVLASGALACSASNSVAGDGGPDVRTITDATAKDAKGHDAGDSGAIDGGTPFLTELRVTAPATADASAPVTLMPAFSPSTYDYYVRCAAVTNNLLTVSLTASPGSLGLVIQPNPSPSLPKQTLLMSVNANQAIVAVATDGTATQQYWVRCLPPDFPHLQMIRHSEAGTPSSGYYLIGNQLEQPGQGGYAMILNGEGVPVWYATSTSGAVVSDVESFDAGVISFQWVGYPFGVLGLSPESATWVLAFGYPTDPHELRILPNGHFLVLWTPVQTGIDLTGIVLPLPDGGVQSFGPDGNIVACDILEVDTMNNVVWSWQATDHFDPAKDIDLLFPPDIGPDGGLIVEPFHCNSIDVDTNGNLLVSARHMDSIFYIDKSTGAVLWKMGGSSYTKDNATYVPVADRFYGQHDARLQPGWKSTCAGGRGQISLFDDQTNQSAPARGAVYDVAIGPADAGSGGDCGIPVEGGTSGDGGIGAATLAWQYAGDASTLGTGSFRVLPDGSRIIGWGSNPTAAFTEVDVGKHDLLDFYFTDGDTTYRAVKVPLSQFNLSVLRNTAGLPVASPP